MGSSIGRCLATLVGIVSMSAGVAYAEDAGDASSQVGTWVHNPHESINMPDPDEAQTVEIRRYDTLLDYTWTGVAKDGKKSTFSYSMAADGVVRALPGSDGIHTSLLNALLLIARKSPSGASLMRASPPGMTS